MEVTDRIASLEHAVCNSAYVSFHLSARPMIAALPLRSTVNNGTVLPKKGGTLPSPSGSKKETKKSAYCMMGTDNKFLASDFENKNFELILQYKCLHLSLTVQIYLHRPSKRSGSSETPKSTSAVPSQSTNTPSEAKVLSDRVIRLGSQNVPPFTLPLRRCTSQLVHSLLEMPSYRSPIKSPSQYFQICY
uniref:Uncharacterized protein n=1 Tax=Sinocyclocheilus grahami TaxID=75366 RepID=A0A672K582_SINGR